MVCHSNRTALSGEAALFIPGLECMHFLRSLPSDFDRLISGYRLIQTASLENPPVAPNDFDRLISVYRLTQTALLGDLYCILVCYVSGVPVRRIRARS